MTPLAIAYWLAGDGHCRKQDGSIEIATHSFTLAEVETLRSCGRPTRWVRLLRPSNPTRLGQAAAGPVLIGYGPEQALLKNLNIETTRYAANRAKEQYRIFIPKREVHKVQGLVKGRIPSMMAYRVGL
jgi:hypothetical protein